MQNRVFLCLSFSFHVQMSFLLLFYSGDGKVLPREPVHASDDRIFTNFFFSLNSELRRAIVGRNVPRLVHLAALGPARHTGLFCTL